MASVALYLLSTLIQMAVLIEGAYDCTITLLRKVIKELATHVLK